MTAAPLKTRSGIISAFCLHKAWLASAATVVVLGIFYLINLSNLTRLNAGPLLITPFRLAFAVSWTLLLVSWVKERHLPRLGFLDLLIIGASAMFILRSMSTPETVGQAVNLVFTGTGTFFLLRWGMRGIKDARVIIWTLAGAAITLSFLGIIEWILMNRLGLVSYAIAGNNGNFFFDAREMNEIGIDQSVAASNQLYRIYTFVGHPGYAAAVMLACVPLVTMSLWRRRGLLAAALAVMAVTIFLTYSRAAWLLALLVLMPLFLFRARFWLRRRLKWVAPLAVIPLLFVTFDYLSREEVSASLGNKNPHQEALAWTASSDGPCSFADGETDGIVPLNRFVYFDVRDDFLPNGEDGASLIIHYLNKGYGAIHVDYYSGSGSDQPEGVFTASDYVNKTDTNTWTTGVFYLENPRFQGELNEGADFRIVDDDSNFVLDKVILQKGKLKLPTLISKHWLARAGSTLDTRMQLFPFAWSVLKENPLGVGPFNTPGTDHHALDSLPLTWLMEFGWPGVPFMLLLLGALVREGIYTLRTRSGPAAVLFLSLSLLLLHGAVLMVLYSKPSLVLFSAVGAVYCLIRPGSRNNPIMSTSNDDYML